VKKPPSAGIGFRCSFSIKYLSCAEGESSSAETQFANIAERANALNRTRVLKVMALTDSKEYAAS
jgi:hypothetical protein